MGRKTKRTGPTVRVPQFDISITTLKRIEEAFDKINVHGHKARYKTGGLVVAKLVEESLGKDFVMVRILDCGALEFLRQAPKSLEPASFPLGHASKATRLEHGMRPDSQE